MICHKSSPATWHRAQHKLRQGVAREHAAQGCGEGASSAGWPKAPWGALARESSQESKSDQIQ
jgi:hypothetical protein